jgi:hypothetical protein
MNEVESVRRYRPRWRVIPLLFVFGLLYAPFALFAPWAAGPSHPGWWLGIVMAASAMFCCVGGPAILLTTVVTVGPAGVTKSPWWNGGFAVEWSQVRSWAVGRPPAWHEAPDDARVVRFQVAGWRRNPVIFDSEVERPGFAAFVAALREAAGGREVTDAVG